jgi:hypothetical protein
MNRRHSTISLLFLVAGALPGCHSPTEPSTSYTLVAYGGSFGTADGSATLLECHQFLDATEGTDPSVFATPTAQIQAGVQALGVPRGHHALVFRVTAQTQSPTTYRAMGITVDLREFCVSLHNPCPLVARVTLPDQIASLRTGEAMTIGFDI